MQFRPRLSKPLVHDVRASTTGNEAASRRIQKRVVCVAAVLGALNIGVVAAETAGLHDRVGCAAGVWWMVEVQGMSKLVSKVV